MLNQSPIHPQITSYIYLCLLLNFQTIVRCKKCLENLSKPTLTDILLIIDVQQSHVVCAIFLVLDVEQALAIQDVFLHGLVGFLDLVLLFK